jgi:hypothetical protein
VLKKNFHDDFTIAGTISLEELFYSATIYCATTGLTPSSVLRLLVSLSIAGGQDYLFEGVVGTSPHPFIPKFLK